VAVSGPCCPVCSGPMAWEPCERCAGTGLTVRMTAEPFDQSSAEVVDCRDCFGRGGVAYCERCCEVLAVERSAMAEAGGS
jgi:hypothetical protein